MGYFLGQQGPSSGSQGIEEASISWRSWTKFTTGGITLALLCAWCWKKSITFCSGVSYELNIFCWNKEWCCSITKKVVHLLHLLCFFCIFVQVTTQQSWSGYWSTINSSVVYFDLMLPINICLQVWKFLLGHFKFDSTYSEREALVASKREQYKVLQTQWKVWPWFWDWPF